MGSECPDVSLGNEAATVEEGRMPYGSVTVESETAWRVVRLRQAVNIVPCVAHAMMRVLWQTNRQPRWRLG